MLQIESILKCAKMVEHMENEFRNLPSVDKLLSDVKIKQLEDLYPHDLIVDLVRKRLEQERHSIAQGNHCLPIDEIVDSVHARMQALHTHAFACGIVAHQGQGADDFVGTGGGRQAGRFARAGARQIARGGQEIKLGDKATLIVRSNDECLPTEGSQVIRPTAAGQAHFRLLQVRPNHRCVEITVRVHLRPP